MSSLCRQHTFVLRPNRTKQKFPNWFQFMEKLFSLWIIQRCESFSAARQLFVHTEEHIELKDSTVDDSQCATQSLRVSLIFLPGRILARAEILGNYQVGAGKRAVPYSSCP